MADTAVRLVMTTKGVRESTRQFKEFETVSTRSMSSAESSVARSLARMAAQYISLGVAVNKAMKVMSSGVEFNKFVENQTMSFTVMMKSAEKAKVQMEQLYNFAVRSPLTFKDTASSAKQLMAYGFTAKELIPTLDKLGTVALATGHSLGDIAYVYGTLRSQGRAYSRDLMQFGMRGIPIYEELAKVMGVNVNQIQKMASEGKIGFKQVESAFSNMTGVGGRFSGMIEQYMSTLTGKLAMLEDIAQKSAGKLMKGATESLKKFVDDITIMLESDEMQAWFTEMNIEIKTLADALFSATKAFIKMLPVLMQTLKMFIAYKAVTSVFSLFKGLPETLLNVGGALMKLSSLGGGAGLLANLGAAGSLFAEGFIMAAPAIMAVLGPIILALQVISDLKKDAYMRSSDEAFAEVFSVEAPKELKIIQGDMNNLRKHGLLDIEAEARLNDEIVTYVREMAKEYKQSESAMAKMLYLSNEISASTAKMLGFDIAGHFAKIQADIAKANTAPIPQSAMERETKYFSEITAKAPMTFVDPTDAHALGRRAGNIFLEGFQNTWKNEKLKWKELFTDDKQQDLLKAELESVTKIYNEAFDRIGESGMEESGFGPRLRERLKELLKLLDGFSSKAKEIKLPSLDKWWLPEDSAVAATLTAIDDVQLAGEKALYNAQKEIDNRQSIIDANLKNAKLMNDSVDKARMLVKWNEENLKLDKERQQILNDINETNTRNTNMQRYAEYTGQGGGIFTAFQAGAGEAFQKAIDNVDITAFADGIANTLGASLEGTEVGSMASGAMSGGVVGLISTIIARFVSLLTTIENVNRSLNALTTIFESMKAVSNIVEIIDNAFEPITKHLEQLGEASAPLTAIFVGLLKIANAVMYLMQSPLLAAIQVLADGFEWFYNSVIVPVGNFIVMAVNAIIKVLNKIPGVHIKYLDSLVKLTSTMDDFTDAANYAKDSLGDTIKYLERKLSEIYDSQLDSIQELYEVGAMSATDYEAQVKTLNDSMVTSQDALVSYADKQLSTQTGILQRLLELYALQKIIDEDKLTPEEMKNLLESHGLTASSLSDIMIGSIGIALTNRDAAAAKAALIKQQEAQAQARAAEMQRAKGTSMSNLETMISKVDSGDFSKNTAKKYLSGIPGPSSYQNARKAALFAFQRDVKATESAIMSATTPEQIKGLYNALTSRWAGLDDKFFKNNSVLSYDVGTGYVPYDMMAQIHKGESIIPKTFMDSIRSGELVLGSNNQGSGQTTIVNVSVQGSVITENDLVDKLTTVIYKQRSRGILTA